MEKQANQRRFLQPQCHTFTLVFEFKILKQILFNAGFDFTPRAGGIFGHGYGVPGVRVV